MKFGNAWKGLSICKDEPEEVNSVHPCEAYHELRGAAASRFFSVVCYDENTNIFI